MPGNLNFAIGTAVHEVARELMGMPKDSIDRKQLKAIFAQNWDKKVKEAYIRHQDDVDKSRELGENIAEKFIKGYETGDFTFSPIEYLPIGKDKPELAVETAFELPAVNVLTGEPLANMVYGKEGDNVDMYFVCSLDFIGTDPKDELYIIDYKTAARAYSKSKIMKEPQLPFYDVILRIAIRLGLIPGLEKKQSDKIAYAVMMKTKKALEGKWSDFFQIWEREITDKELEFFYWNLKQMVFAMENGPYCACPGNQCDNMCAHRPICDAFMRGEDPEDAYNKFMLEWENS